MSQSSTITIATPQNRKPRNFIDHVLEPPSYGWQDKENQLVIPTSGELFSEFLFRLNVFRDKKNWLTFFSWARLLLLVSCLFIFLVCYFNVYLLIVAFLYSMIVMGTHGTIWYHRYCTHGAYTFSNKFWRFVTRNLTINIVPEETYVVSHHVHHAKSDEPGDPYNAQAGFLYCFLADVNHQPIALDLDEAEYARVVKLMGHTGVKPNTFDQYRRWGSIVNPARAIIGWLANWTFWGLTFYWIGGPALLFTLFGAAGFWAIGVRTFNYEGHGKGKEKHRDGTDFNRKDLSINQVWPGFVAGEWHNNHHLYPSSARSGFLNYQLDLAWCYIRFLSFVGAVSTYHDSKKLFLSEHHHPYLESKEQSRLNTRSLPTPDTLPRR